VGTATSKNLAGNCPTFRRSIDKRDAANPVAVRISAAGGANVVEDRSGGVRCRSPKQAGARDRIGRNRRSRCCTRSLEVNELPRYPGRYLGRKVVTIATGIWQELYDAAARREGGIRSIKLRPDVPSAVDRFCRTANIEDPILRGDFGRVSLGIYAGGCGKDR
jgi:hypothetical protein